MLGWWDMTHRKITMFAAKANQQKKRWKKPRNDRRTRPPSLMWLTSVEAVVSWGWLVMQMGNSPPKPPRCWQAEVLASLTSVKMATLLQLAGVLLLMHRPALVSVGKLNQTWDHSLSTEFRLFDVGESLNGPVWYKTCKSFNDVPLSGQPASVSVVVYVYVGNPWQQRYRTYPSDKRL